MTIECRDSLEYMKGIEEYGLDMIYADPPYALGSEVIIRKDGRVDYAKANDFMNKWTMPTGDYWADWFFEAFRTLKYGGYCVMFGMDRQLLLFKYYAHLAGFEEQQSLYWYFISNFPKATDLSKGIDRFYGTKGEVIGESKGQGYSSLQEEKIEQMGEGQYVDGISHLKADKNIYGAGHDLAKKYEGYKYSISPLKQTNETIMVFHKPTKTGSPLHDTLAYENGDKTITVSALNIDGNRVGTNQREQFSGKGSNGDVYLKYPQENAHWETVEGRYPAQTFISSQTAEILDRQSENYSIEEDVSCSKILHKCNYEQEDYDLYNYEPKVSGSERNAGCDDREAINVNDGRNTPIDNPYQRGETLRVNTHPTLKPIALNEKILSLFKTPNDQKICYPFAGAGSEIIGGIKAGFKNWCGCEISQEYVDIANARIKYWKEEMTTQTSIFDFID